MSGPPPVCLDGVRDGSLWFVLCPLAVYPCLDSLDLSMTHTPLTDSARDLADSMRHPLGLHGFGLAAPLREAKSMQHMAGIRSDCTVFVVSVIVTCRATGSRARTGVASEENTS